MIKKFFTFLLLLFCTSILYGQGDKIKVKNGKAKEIYYHDKEGKKQGKYTYKYKNYSQVTGHYLDDAKEGLWIYEPDENFKISGYYTSGKEDSIWKLYVNNTLFISANSRTKKSESYFPDGELRSESDSLNGKFHYTEYNKSGGVIKKVIIDSVFTERKIYDEAGNLIEHIILKDHLPYNIFIADKRNKEKYFAGNISDGNGELHIKVKREEDGQFYTSEILQLKESKPDGKYMLYSAHGRVLVYGEYQQGFMSGKWIKYSSDGSKLITTLSISVQDSLKYDFVNHMGLYEYLTDIKDEHKPLFLGQGLDQFRWYIASNLRYPEQAGRNGIHGRVYLQFVVDNNGKVVDAEVIKGVHPLLDQEALRVIQSSPYWRPGIKYGQPIKTKFNIPVNFALQ